MMNEVAVVVGGVLLFFGMLIGACLYSETINGDLHMACIQLQGEWMGNTCIFRR